MTKRPLHLVGMSLCAVALAAVASGCGADWQSYTEKFKRAGIARPGGKDVPQWVQGRLPRGEEEIYFVGRGVGNHVLDERGAYDAAVDHVVEQVAKQVATIVNARAESRSGRQVRSAAKMATRAMVGDIAPRDVYWEQWYVEEMAAGPCDRGQRMQRYKCWVLMSIPKKAMAQRVAATQRALKIHAAGPNTLFAAVGMHSDVGGQ